MARGVAHSEEVKAAVMAALLAGQSLDSVAAQYKIPEGTVKGWSREILSLRRVEEMGGARNRIGDLIIRNIEATFEATQRIIERVSTDEEWLSRQEAPGLAVFIGVLFDKGFRMVEALPDSADGSLLAAGEAEPETAGG